MSGFLSDVHAIVLEQGVGKARAQILRKQLESKGGTAVSTLSEATTYVLVGNNVRLSRVPSLLKVNSLPDGVLVLRADWLSTCLVKGERVDVTLYSVKQEESSRSSLSLLKVGASLSPIKGRSSQPPEKERVSLSPVRGDSPKTKFEVVSPVKSELESEHIASSIAIGGEPEEERTTTGTATQPSSSLHQEKFPNVSRHWKVSPKKNLWDTLDSDSDYLDSGEEEAELEGKEVVVPSDGAMQAAGPPPAKKRRWLCDYAASDTQSWVNHNKHITTKLEELLVVYQNNGEQWRAMSTRKVIQKLKTHPKEITTYEEAQSIPHVGESLAAKIWEIISSGHLRRLDQVNSEKEMIIDMFKYVHGVGQVTAQQFYAQGYRTLEELEKSGILNRQQMIGIKYYYEFRERMQRSEVAEIEEQVRQVAQSIDPGLEVITCGSYRRGRETCGDVDILITHPDGRSHRGVFTTLLERCTKMGFFTDDLSIHNDPVGPCKYLGVCKLLGDGRKHRRIDILVVPYSQFFCALVHFTGSGHYNRSMRSKADALGMSLSEHSINTGVIRKNGVKIFNGTPLPVFSEEDIFKYLAIPYVEPKDRDYD